MKYTFTVDLELPMVLSDIGRVRLGRYLKDMITDWFEHNVHKFCYPCEEDEWLDNMGVDNARVDQ